MDGFITFCGKYLIVFSLLITAYLFYKIDNAQRRKFIYQLVIGGLLAITIARLATHLYSNPRPFVSDGIKAVFDSSTNNGFPSDHTLLASFLGFSALIYSRKIGLVLLAIALFVAWGRVAGGVHHGVDVAASFLISGLAVWATKLALDRYWARNHKLASNAQHKQKNKN